MNLRMSLMTMAALTLVFVGFSSCSKDEGDEGSESSSSSYAGPGSDWNIVLDEKGGTFELTENDTSSVTSGTYTKLDSGFLKMTVAKKDGSAGPPVDSTFTSINVPDYMFAIKPITGSQMITMVTSGACRTGGFNLNWVAVNRGDGGLSGHDYGTIAWDINSGSVQIDTAFQPDSTALGSPLTLTTITGSQCNEGIAEPASGTERMYITHAGGMIINTNTGNNTSAHFLMGLEAEEMTISNLEGNWYGFVFDGSDADTGEEVLPVTAVIASDGAVTLTAIDPETGSAEGSLVQGTLDFIDLNFNEGAKDHHGMLRYDFTPGGSPNGGCAVDVTIQEDTNKRIIMCAGTASDDSSDYNLVLVYKP